MSDITPANIPNGTSDRKVLLIVLDGVRWDKLKEARTPNIDALAAQGHLGSTMTHDPDKYSVPTVSGPGHSTILTGVWPDKHQVVSNEIEPHALDLYPDMLTRLRTTRPLLSTFAIGDWPPLMNQILGSPHAKVLIPYSEGSGDGAASAQRIIAWASTALTSQNPDVGYVYLIRADYVGHRSGGASAAYIDAIEELDQNVGALVHAVRSRDTYDEEDWLILATTDHGHVDNGGHGGAENEVREIWTLVAGGYIQSSDPAAGGLALVDIVPTALRHLGVEIDPVWNLDGNEPTTSELQNHGVPITDRE